MSQNHPELRKLIREFARENDLDWKKLRDLFKQYYQNGAVEYIQLQKDFTLIDYTYSSAFLQLAARLNPDEAGRQNAFFLKVINDMRDNYDSVAKMFFGPISEKRKVQSSDQDSKEEALQQEAEAIVEKIAKETPPKPKVRRRPKKTKRNRGRWLEIMMSMLVGKINYLYPDFYIKEHPEYFELLGFTSKYELDIIPLQFLLVENRLLRLQVKEEYREIVEKYAEEKRKARELEAARPQELEDWMKVKFSKGYDKAENAPLQCASDYASQWLQNEEDIEWWRSRSYSDGWNERDELRSSLLHQGYSPGIIKKVLNEFFIEDEPSDPLESQLDNLLSPTVS